jgi:hypothetical protein
MDDLLTVCINHSDDLYYNGAQAKPKAHTVFVVSFLSPSNFKDDLYYNGAQAEPKAPRSIRWFFFYLLQILRFPLLLRSEGLNQKRGCVSLREAAFLVLDFFGGSCPEERRILHQGRK